MPQSPQPVSSPIMSAEFVPRRSEHELGLDRRGSKALYSRQTGKDLFFLGAPSWCKEAFSFTRIGAETLGNAM